MATPTALPAAFTVGEVLTSSNMNLLRGATRILQVVFAETSTLVSNSTTTHADTTLTATITPTSNTSKVLAYVVQNVNKTNGDSQNGVAIRLLRGATTLQNFSVLVSYTGTALDLWSQVSGMYLDSPATTSATTYKTQIANYSPTAAVNAQPTGSISSIVLMEVSA
jgi:hypothetical protein